jgi:TP901 family phage tail tape measure protein
VAMTATVGVLRALLTLDTASFHQNIRGAQAELKTFSTSTKAFGREATSLGSTLSKTLTLPILGFGGLIAKAAMDFETSFAGIRKTVSATAPELAKLSQEMRNLAKTIPVNVNELNSIGQAAGQLGIDIENIAAFTEVMAKLGVSTNLGATEAATKLAQLANITQMSQTKFNELGATIVWLGNNFATTGEAEIAEFGLRIAGAGHLAKMSEADILGIGTALASVGVRAEAGGTAVQKVIINMIEAVTRGGRALDIFSETAARSGKISAEMWRDLFRERPAEAFVQFIEGLSKSGEQQITILQQLGLVDQRLIRSFTALAGAGDKTREAVEGANKAFREGTALNKEAATRFGTLANQLKTLWNQVSDVAITLGTALMPTMKDLVAVFKSLMPFVERVAQGFADLPAPVRDGIVAIGLFVAVLGPLTWMVGQLALSLSGVAQAFSATGIATVAIRGTLGLLTTGFGQLGIAVTATQVAVGLFTGALALIVVPFALNQLIKAWTELNALMQAHKDWQKDEANDRSVFANTMRIAREKGFKGTDQKDAEAFLNKIGENLREQQAATEIMKKLQSGQMGFPTDIRQNPTINGLLGVKGAATAAAEGTKHLSEEYKELLASVRALAPWQKRDIEAGLKMHDLHEDIALRIGTTAKVVDVYKDQMEAAAAATNKATRSFDEFTGAADRLQATQVADALEKGVLQLSRMTEEQQRDTAEALKKGYDSWKALGTAVPESVSKQLAAVTQLRLIPDMLNEEAKAIANLSKVAKIEGNDDVIANQERALDEIGRITNLQLKVQQDSQDRWERMGEQRLEHERKMAESAGAAWETLADLDARLALSRFENAKRLEERRFAMVSMNVKETSQEYALLVTEHRGAMEQITQDFLLSEAARLDALRRTHNVWLKTWASVKKAADDALRSITDGLAEIALGLKSFKETFVGIWQSIRQAIAKILGEMLHDFIYNYLKKLIAAQAAAKIATGGGGGGGGIGNLAGSAISKYLVGLFGGGGATSIAGATSITGGGALLSGGATGGGGALATTHLAGSLPTTAAAGGAGGAGLAAAVPYAGPAAAAIALYWGIRYKGLFRGGEEGIKVNPRRDAFMAQFGDPSNKGVGGGAWNLANLLARKGAHPNYFSNIQSAITLKGLYESEDYIITYLNKHGYKGVKKFNMGGFVPPGAIVPAILHGGRFGEVVAPMTAPAGAAAAAVGGRHNSFHFDIQAWDGEDVSRVFRREIIPRLKQALQLNQDDMLGHTKRVLR